MRKLYRVDGVRIKYEMPDLDGDGEVGGIETVRRSRDNDVVDVKETTELKDVMDTVFPRREHQRINMLGNINKFEAMNIFKLRSLVNAKFLPFFCLNVSDEYLEISVSGNARGRDDARDITIGKMERDSNLKDKVKNLAGVN